METELIEKLRTLGSSYDHVFSGGVLCSASQMTVAVGQREGANAILQHTHVIIACKIIKEGGKVGNALRTDVIGTIVTCLLTVFGVQCITILP